ncbi:hypothetical protein K1719_029992 [Acacia pycnantha]|nr:hypothetical protein K1719_029992 [Acacia pycnantha]
MRNEDDEQSSTFHEGSQIRVLATAPLLRSDLFLKFSGDGEGVAGEEEDAMDAHEQSKAVTKAPAMKTIKQRMEKDVDEVKKIAHHIKTKIEELDKENLANRQKPGCGKGSGVDRSRTATTTALRKKLKDKIAEFQVLREAIHREYREVVERRVYTVTGTRADEETIDRLIETGDSEQIFQKAIQEQGRGQIIDTLAEIQERHEAVRDVERKLLELQQEFLHKFTTKIDSTHISRIVLKNSLRFQNSEKRSIFFLGKGKKKALPREDKLIIPQGKFYLADAGFSLKCTTFETL